MNKFVILHFWIDSPTEIRIYAKSTESDDAGIYRLPIYLYLLRATQQPCQYSDQFIVFGFFFMSKNFYVNILMKQNICNTSEKYLDEMLKPCFKSALITE